MINLEEKKKIRTKHTKKCFKVIIFFFCRLYKKNYKLGKRYNSKFKRLKTCSRSIPKPAPKAMSYYNESFHKTIVVAF